jgi:ABC-type multidrug transport system fused ATPase/permease subunit
MQGVAAAQRIFAVLETPVPGDASREPARPAISGEREVGRGASLPPGDQPVPPPARLDLCFSGVHYAYDDGERPALSGLSFNLPHGESLALVGPSGAGKSTVAYLLLRFIEPDLGTISVGGRSLQALSPAAWREQVAWVPQNPYLFHGTVAENICLARPDANGEQVERAVRQASAHDFVQALPQGYDTVIGERGARLSGGEAQRVALARAFLKDAPLLILDEATANLDPESEAQVQEAIARLLVGRTALIIAHRLSTVYRARRIVVVDQGRLAEAGTHVSLMQQNGLYRRLVGAYGGVEGA